MTTSGSLPCLGSGCSISTRQFEKSISIVGRVSTRKSFSSFGRVCVRRRWRYVSVCKYSVTTEIIDDLKSSISHESTFIGSSDDDDLLLRRAPKPVSKSASKDKSVLGMDLLPWDPSNLSEDSQEYGSINGEEEEIRNMDESLGEVLEKAERLETGKKISLPVKNSPSNTRTERNGRRVSSNAIQKSNYVNVVWQKGDPTATTSKDKSVSGTDLLPCHPSNLSEDSQEYRSKNGEEEGRQNVVDSSGEVLEKAERLETGKKISLPVKNSPSSTRTEPRNGRRVSSDAIRKSNYVNGVWQKGDPVAATQKAFEESPKIEKIIEKQEPRTEVVGKVESLGEVLEKAERLETGKKISLPVKNSPSNTRSEPRNGRRVSSDAIRKSNYVNIVWQKGDPVAATRKAVEESPNIEKIIEKQEPRREIVGKVESLGEVLEKAERLETGKKISLPIKNSPSNTRTEPRNGGRVGSNANRESNYVNIVWQKGDLVATTRKAVEESPNIEKIIEKQEPRTKVVGKVNSQPVSPLRPLQPLQKDQSKLQPKPSTAPPAAIGKSFILKDVGAAPRPSVTDDAELHSKTEEHKPILIDRFANQKSVIDPPVAQAVLVPLKPVKGGTSNSNKFKNVFRNKSSSSAGQRRRIVDVVGIPDEEEASELNVSIRGASIARKGRKWNKASRKAARLQADREAAPVKVEILEVGEEGMLTEELAYNLAISEGKILGSLYSKGIKPDGVQTLSKDMVKMICKEHEVEVIDAAPVRVEEMAKKNEILDEDDLDKLEDRPPVLTIMGHVDHGKTTLLDYIRKSKVAASEAGGITQGIGAYKVQVPIDGKWQPCVFLDTPGHEAFGAMRARGARVTDIAIIVVAADDGIRPQTNEAVAHAKAAGVPIVIAINKIDKEGANPERVMEELSSIGVIPEAWGGDVPMVKISALKGENIDDLLETVMLVAELQELKANPHKYAKGTAIEAGMDKSKGPLATFLVQNGTLKRGDVVVCGEGFGKVRALFDDNGKRVDEAGPSIPVQVIGLNNVPLAGDEFGVVCSLDVAREKAELRAESIRNERISAKAGDGKITLSSLASAVSSGKHAGLDLHQLNIIMKVDVQGSIEAIRQALQVLPQDNVTLKFLLQATGDVSRSDVDLASASKAIIFGFNVRAPGSVKSHSDNKGVEIRLYKVIYDLIDDVRYAMEGLLEPVEDQVPIGSAEVRATFSSGSGRVAGCMVTEGKVVKECGIRVLRKGKAIFIGTLDSLKRVKESVKEVNTGLECGIGIDDFSDWEVGDTIETFNTVQKKRTLEEASASIAAALEEVGIKL